MSVFRRFFLFLSLLLCQLFSPAAWAEMSEAQQQEIRSAFQDAAKVSVLGPGIATLADQAELTLPKDVFFIPKAEGARLMRALGNHVSEQSFLGLVMPGSDSEDWMVTLNIYKEGYVKDDDAKDWNVEELFTSLKEGTEAANEERRKSGFPELILDGWQQKPTYSAETHRLVWAMLAHDKASPDQRSINYNTYGLGRDGYISLNLITSPDSVDKDKVQALALLEGLTYVPGKRYTDFVASSDHVAEYGLAGLIGVGVAKKLGFFAVIAAFAAKFFKVILLALIGFGAAFRKLFTRNKD